MAFIVKGCKFTFLSQNEVKENAILSDPQQILLFYFILFYFLISTTYPSIYRSLEQFIFINMRVEVYGSI